MNSLQATWANLRVPERRLIIAVAVALFLVINLVWVWPHFNDWPRLQSQRQQARETLEKFEEAIAQVPGLQEKVRALEKEGAAVALEDQANEFLRAVQSQAARSGVSILSVGQPKTTTRTNEFFVEQSRTINLEAREEQLVDFLYHLGSSESMIRARGLSLRPNPQRQKLQANVDLVATYQKKPATRAAPAARAAATAAAVPAPPGPAPASKTVATPARPAPPVAATAPSVSGEKPIPPPPAP